ncbi:hypothetical protein H072_4953 [Dactylellina haptotyla CBS 200.50]|uniref:Uncharacterized protein n=1 Tax=Dactylellina haptotyla (strain CBS 200.50) TaxID=1284197 RepID=S8BNR7_DACHA|nr:hypothetical protein H072_4953 [Dactylellina haptotyla CBS 200.50]
MKWTKILTNLSIYLAIYLSFGDAGSQSIVLGNRSRIDAGVLQYSNANRPQIFDWEGVRDIKRIRQQSDRTSKSTKEPSRTSSTPRGSWRESVLEKKPPIQPAPYSRQFTGKYGQTGVPKTISPRSGDSDERKHHDYWDSVRKGETIRRHSIELQYTPTEATDAWVPEPQYPPFWRSNSPFHDKSYPDPTFFHQIGVNVIRNGPSYQKFEFQKWALQPGAVILVSPKDQHLVFSWTEASIDPSNLMYWVWQAGAAPPPGEQRQPLKYITIYDLRPSSSQTLGIITTVISKRRDKTKSWFSMSVPSFEGQTMYDSQDIEIWDALIGTAEIAAVQTMANTYRRGLQNSIISKVHFWIKNFNSRADGLEQTANILVELKQDLQSTKGPKKSINPEHSEELLTPTSLRDRYSIYSEEPVKSPLGYSGEEAFDITMNPVFNELAGTTYNYAPGLYGYPHLPTYQTVRVNCLTALGTNLELEISTSGQEEHVVIMECQEGVEEDELLGDIIWQVWEQREGSYQTLQDITFVAIAQKTLAVIENARRELGLEGHDVMILDWFNERDRGLIGEFWLTRELSAVVQLIQFQDSLFVVSTIEVSYPIEGEFQDQPILLVRLTTDEAEAEKEESLRLDEWIRNIEVGIDLRAAMNLAQAKPPAISYQGIEKFVLDYAPTKLEANPTSDLIKDAIAASGASFTFKAHKLFQKRVAEDIRQPQHIQIVVNKQLKLFKSVHMAHMAIISYPGSTEGLNDEIRPLSDILYLCWRKFYDASRITNLEKSAGLNLPHYFSIVDIGQETQAIIQEVFIQGDLGPDDQLWMSGDSVNDEKATVYEKSRWLAMLGTVEVTAIEEMNIRYSRDLNSQRIAEIFIRWTNTDPHWQLGGNALYWGRRPQIFVVCKTKSTANAVLNDYRENSYLAMALDTGERLELEAQILRYLRKPEPWPATSLGLVVELQTDIPSPSPAIQLFKLSGMKTKEDPKRPGTYVRLTVSSVEALYNALIFVSDADRHLIIERIFWDRGVFEVEDVMKTMAHIYFQVWNAYSTEILAVSPDTHEPAELSELMRRHYLRGVSLLRLSPYTQQIIRNLDRRKVLYKNGVIRVYQAGANRSAENRAMFLALLGAPEVGAVQKMLLDHPERTYRAVINSILVRYNPETQSLEAFVKLFFNSPKNDGETMNWLEAVS